MIKKTQTAKPEADKILLRRGMKRSDTLKNRLAGRMDFFCIEEELEIVRMVKEGDFDFVWIDSGVFGSTVRRLKRECPDTPVYVFYHIVNTTSDTIKTITNYKFGRRWLLDFWNQMNSLKQEKLSARYADANIVLNKRDRDALKKRFGRDADLELPVCLADNAHIAPVAKKPDEFNILFVGLGHHKPNVDGIKWFAANVVPHLDRRAKLRIVGTAMYQHEDSPEFQDRDRITIISDAESLDPYYNAADIVVAPIFYGAGMMTKTVEAMMWGKNYLATSHALHGYEGLDDCRCDTAEEFITKINALISLGKDERFNPEMRKIYEDKYSLSAMENMIREFLVKQKIKL